MKTGRSIEKLKLAVLRSVTPEKVGKAKWVVYSAVALSTTLMLFGEGPGFPKIPKYLGD
jgi:hypothetical protein